MRLLRRGRSARAVGSWILVLGLALTACASDGSSSDPVPDDADDAAADEASGDDAADDDASGDASADADADVVRYQDSGPLAMAMFVHYQSMLQGYYEDNNLEIEENAPIFNANQIIQTFLQGDADLGITGATGPVEAAAAGQYVDVLAIVANPMPFQLTLNQDAADRLAEDGVTVDSPVADKMEALSGLSFASAATGSTTDLMFRFVLAEYGLDAETDVQIQPLSDGQAVATAAREGTVDGFVGFPAASTQPEADGWGVTFIDFGSEDADIADIPMMSVIGRPDYVDENPDVVVRFLESLAAATQDADDLTPEMRTALKDTYYAEMSQEAFDLSIDSIMPVIPTDIVPTEEHHEALRRLVAITGSEPDVSFEDLYRPEFAEQVMEGLDN